MPISRFLDWLVESGNLQEYMERLVATFNPAAVPGLMCRNTISVGWDGTLHDCDFNQMLDLPVEAPPGRRPHVRDLDPAWLDGAPDPHRAALLRVHGGRRELLRRRHDVSQPPRLLPDDVHNRALVENVHPPGWQNPEPARRYNLVVVGAGTAGLVAAAGAAGLGARVALVERHFMGGDCLVTGCVPSKAVIRSARVVGEIREAAALGVKVPGGVAVDFGAVMERMRRIRAEISPHDSAWRFARELGVDVFLGDAAFTGPDALAVDGPDAPLRASRHRHRGAARSTRRSRVSPRRDSSRARPSSS